MKISIAMTTYNGESLIISQLDSILSQSLLPNEIVIVDDASADDTYSVVKTYSKRHPEVEWIIKKNNINCGWKENFAKAILLTSGEYIFLCDQDDIWYYKKIEIIIEQFLNNNNAGIIACAYKRINPGETDNRNYEIKSGYLHKEFFDRNFYMVHHPGCSMAFKSFYKEIFFYKEWDGTQPHDEYLWCIAKILGNAYYYDEELQFFIRHENSATNKKINRKYDRLNQINEKINCVDKISKVIINHKELNISQIDKKLKLCMECISFLQLRYSFVCEPSFLKIFNLFKYIGQYENVSFFLKDIFCSLKNN